MTNIEEKNDVGLADPSKSQMIRFIYDTIGGFDFDGNIFCMIGDVLGWCEENSIYDGEGSISCGICYGGDVGIVLSKRKEKRKPIQDQPIECIKFVYDLCKQS